jgi:hypothetical protein
LPELPLELPEPDEPPELLDEALREDCPLPLDPLIPPDELREDPLMPLDEPDEPLELLELLLSCDRLCDAESPERSPSPCDDELRSRFWSLFLSFDEPLREFVFPWFAIPLPPKLDVRGRNRPARPGAPLITCFA